MPLTGNGVRFPVAEPLLGVYDGRMLGNVNSIRDMDPTSMAFALDFWLPAAAAKILHQITPTLRSPILMNLVVDPLPTDQTLFQT